MYKSGDPEARHYDSSDPGWQSWHRASACHQARSAAGGSGPGLLKLEVNPTGTFKLNQLQVVTRPLIVRPQARSTQAFKLLLPVLV